MHNPFYGSNQGLDDLFFHKFDRVFEDLAERIHGKEELAYEELE
jgi:hypothetical protein